MGTWTVGWVVYEAWLKPAATDCFQHSVGRVSRSEDMIDVLDQSGKLRCQRVGKHHDIFRLKERVECLDGRTAYQSRSSKEPYLSLEWRTRCALTTNLSWALPPFSLLPFQCRKLFHVQLPTVVYHSEDLLWSVWHFELTVTSCQFFFTEMVANRNVGH